MVCSTTELPQHSVGDMPQALAFRNPSYVSMLMTDKSAPERTIERKKREAAALKANMKKRKEQAAKQSEGKKVSAELEEDGQLDG
jgi:hypothetical protein